MPSKPPPSGWRWGLRAVIALQCLLVLAFVLQGFGAPAPSGPRLPAVQGQTLWLESHGALHQFDGEGRRLRRIELSTLKLSSPTSLQFTQDNVFWVHDESRVHRCTLDPLRCTPLDLADLGTRREYRWVRVSDDESEVTVSDASRHRVLVYRRDAATGRYALARTLATGLRFPNQTLPADPGMWVADTNQHRIVHWGAADAIVSAHPIAHPGLRPGRKFPFAMARDPQERLWVLVASGNMQRADVLVMTRQLQPERVIALSAQQDPGGIALFQQQMLITDMSQFTVYRRDPQGHALPAFGDAAFQTELDAARQQAQWARRLPTLLLAGTAVLVLLALVLAWKAGELRQLRGAAWRKPPDGTGEPSAPTPSPSPAHRRGRITTIQALPGSTRPARRILVLVGAVSAVLVAALLYWAWPEFYQRDCAPGRSCSAGLASLMVLPPVLLAVLVYGLTWRQLKVMESVRIGTDGIQLQVQVGRRHYKALADEVTCTRQHLYIGMGVIPLRYRGAPLFDEAALRRDIIDRLPQLRMHDSIWTQGLLGHYWRFGGWRGKAAVACLGGLAALMLGLWAMRLF